MLKQASANATATATEDQASSTSAPAPRTEFELNITEDTPTADQVQTILGYVGASGISSIIKGASSESDALKKFKTSPDSFQRPIVRLSSPP